MSRHRLTPYNATISTDIHKYEVSGSSSIDTYFLKQLVLLELTQQSDKQFHLSTTLLLNSVFPDNQSAAFRIQLMTMSSTSNSIVTKE